MSCHPRLEQLQTPPAHHITVLLHLYNSQEYVYSKYQYSGSRGVSSWASPIRNYLYGSVLPSARKKVRKIWISTVLRLLNNLLSLKTEVYCILYIYVRTLGKYGIKQKNHRRKRLNFCWQLESHRRKEHDPDPDPYPYQEYRSADPDPYENVTDTKNW